MSIHREDPIGFGSAQIGHAVVLQMKATAAEVITQAKVDAVEYVKNLKGLRADPDNLEGEVFHQSRKRTRNAFNQFKAALEEKYKDAEGWEDLFKDMAISHGKMRYFTTDLEKEFVEVMNQALRERGLLPSKDDQGPSDGSGPSNMIKV